jgi:hypothetical protein
MQGRSLAFDATVVNSHTAVQAVDIIQDGKVVLQPQVHSGSATADRTQDQMRSMEVELSDPTGTLTPTDMYSILAPFGTRVQLFKGVRIRSVDTRASFYGTQQSWLPSGASTGVMNGVKVDSTGAIALGP